MKRTAVTAAGLVLLSFAIACAEAGSQQDEAESRIFGALGDPIPGLSEDERQSFERGRELALRRFTPETGLGPEFNLTFCGGCHEKPVLGGSAGHYRDFLMVGNALLGDVVVPRGKNGIQRQFSLSIVREPSDPQTDVSATRNPVPFFGMGLLAEIPEEEILRRHDPEDSDEDGISGRVNLDGGFVGRFGRKAQTASIEIFVRGPLFNHMGITSIPLSDESRARLPMQAAPHAPSEKQAVLPDEETIDQDAVRDPELSEAELFDLVSFAMLLAAPRPDAPTEQTDRGARGFDAIGCAGCHVPELTGPRGPIPAYSDLLLHDMGEDLADGFPMGESSGAEFRTQPLWGISAVGPYLHDGRADTVDQAIRWHGGEAEAAAARYAGLTDEERDDVLAFLRSLGGASQRSDGLLPPDSPIPATGEYGAPLEGLDADQRALFERGRALFDRDMGYSDGLGPAFNGDSCRGCHFDPVIGGAGPSGVDAMRQGIVDDGVFLAPVMGTAVLRHASTPNRPEPDSSANVFERRQTPTALGLGLIERIPAEAILFLEDPGDVDQDGIAGRAHVLPDGRLGRFGWKANVPSVREFVRDALSGELGMTVPPESGSSFGEEGDEDDAPDPEAPVETIDAIAGFLSLLAPPPRSRKDPALEDVGRALFSRVGCDRCHVPKLETDRGEAVPLYSDLLLHDVSEPEAVGIEEGEAGMRDFRTPPLWGLAASAPYMHDGRASTVEAAIASHDGEAAASRDSVSELDPEARAALIAFLESL